jgi:y4mF family transcriptional regulator
MSTESLATFVASKRKALKLTQPQLADRAGVGLRFLRELEAGKATLRMDKVNDVLRQFGHELGPVPMTHHATNDASG